MPVLRFNGGPEVPALGGRDLLGSLITAGQPIHYLCMAGSCRQCRVRIVVGADLLEPADPDEARRCDDGYRLACQTVLKDGDGTVSVEQ